MCQFRTYRSYFGRVDSNSFQPKNRKPTASVRSAYLSSIMIRANTIIKNDTIHLNILITFSMLSILYMRFSVSMKIFNLHVVSMTFIMLDFLFRPYCIVCQRSQRNNCHDNHGDKHHHKDHFFGPYKDLVTPIKKIAETPIPQTNMTALLGSLKKSLSSIFFTCFYHSKGSKNGRNPKTDIDSVEFCIWTVHKEEQIDGQCQR